MNFRIHQVLQEVFITCTNITFNIYNNTIRENSKSRLTMTQNTNLIRKIGFASTMQARSMQKARKIILYIHLYWYILREVIHILHIQYICIFMIRILYIYIIYLLHIAYALNMQQCRHRLIMKGVTKKKMQGRK